MPQKKIPKQFRNSIVYVYMVCACLSVVVSSYVRFNFVVVTWQTLKDVGNLILRKNFHPLKFYFIAKKIFMCRNFSLFIYVAFND